MRTKAIFSYLNVYPSTNGRTVCVREANLSCRKLTIHAHVVLGELTKINQVNHYKIIINET